MIKFTSTQDFNFDVEAVNIITDYKELIKKASAKADLQFKKTANQTDLHIIALGADEGYGCNRNGDAFSEEDCKKNHKTFEQANRAVHRHHKNKKTDPKFGNIKAAAYNEPMKRIELIVGLDNDKCADILQEQEKTGNSNWSMACRLSGGDNCSWCNHNAKSDKDRCEHIPKHLGEMNKEGHVCKMLNPNPNWFEISHVFRPADRIGMSLKLASDSRITPMSTLDYLNLYPGFEVPEDELYISKKAQDKRELVRKLAEMEKHIDAVSSSNKPVSTKDMFLARQSKLNKSKKMDKKNIDGLRKHNPDKAFKAMADKGVILNPDEFTEYLFGNRAKPEVTEGMKSHLPKVYSKLDEEGADKAVNNEKFTPSSLDMLPKELSQLVGGLFKDHSLFGDPSVKRVMQITISMGPTEKSEKMFEKRKPTDNKADEKMAEVYATYKLAALNYLQEKNQLTDEILWNALIQNR